MYKRRELKVYKHGYYDLAKNVIRQWREDGMPVGDEVGIEIWRDLLKEHMNRNVNRAVRRGSVGTARSERYTEEH